MKRMKGADAHMIYGETVTSPATTLKITIYDQVDNDNPATAADLRRAWHKVARITPRLSMRVIQVPLGLNHPVWVEDPFYNPDNHIQLISLPKPGDKQALCDFVSFIMSQPMDMNRPLWETWIVDGLENNQLAAFTKVHHALADGSVTARLITEIHEKHLSDGPDESLPREKTTAPIPGKLALARDAIIDMLTSYVTELPGHIQRYVSARQSKQEVERLKKDSLGAFDAPFTILNEIGSQHRAYYYEELPFAEFKALSRQWNGTINDLVVVMMSEMLRRYLLARDALPSDPLVIAIPVSTRPREGREGPEVTNTNMFNNRMALAYVTLDLGIEDIRERFDAAQASCRKAVEIVRLSGGRRVDDWYDFLPRAFPRLTGSVMKWRQKRGLGPMFNTGISNVPGPRQELLICNGKLRLDKLLSCGHLFDFLSLNATVWSYKDKLFFSFYCRKEIIPEPRELGNYLLEAYSLAVEHCDKQSANL